MTFDNNNDDNEQDAKKKILLIQALFSHFHIVRDLNT